MINLVKKKKKKIKNKLLEIREMTSEIPQDCLGNSEEAHRNRVKYLAVRSKVQELLEIL